MKSFLAHTAEYLGSQLHPDLENVLILVPNKRTGLFLEKELMRVIPSPFIMPRIIPIEEFIQQYSSLVEGEPLELNITLYKVFSKYSGMYESFDQFYYWGDMLVRDYNDIDKNMVDAAELFQLMQDIKEIDQQFQYLLPEQIDAIKKFWSSFNPPDISGVQQNFIETWKILNPVFNEFKEILIKEGKGYSGMMFREVSEKITSLELDLPYKNIAFVGFHILSRSEEKIFDFYKKNKMGVFFWDVDEYYLDYETSRIKNHEAGGFLRKYVKKYKNAILPTKFTTSPPHLQFIEAPKNNGQAMIVRTLLDQHKIPYNEKTAIVLPDETMLVPALQSISKENEPINITLGYNLKNSTLTGLIDHWLDIFKYKSGDKFYYKPIVKLLHNVYIKALYPFESSAFEEDILKNNLIYIHEEDIAGHPFLQQFLLMNIDTSSEIINRIKTLLEKLYYHYFDQAENDNTGIFETEILYKGLLSISQMEEIFKENNIQIHPDTLKKLLHKYIGSASVNFSGEPISGLQIMGLLESRNLDFENVFILNANEGILPASISSGSFIPYNLRWGFGLPTYNNNDSMYAYYIYRLLHRSKNVYFIYNNVADETVKAEPSRYIVQLQLESRLAYTEYHQKIEFTTPQTLPIVIEKNKKVMEQLSTYYTEGSDNYLTPSALNTYLDCTFKFYLKYIAGIKETEDVTEEIDASIFGNLLHNTMQLVYQLFSERTKKKTIEKEDITILVSFVDEAIKQAMMQEFSNPKRPKPIDLEGDYYFIFHILQKYVLNILRADESTLPKPVPVIEEKYVFEYSHHQKIRIGGRIDRIDNLGELIKVVDYKTGKADKKNEFFSMDELFDGTSKTRKDYIFQIFLYSYLLQKHQYPDKKVVPELLFIRETWQKDFEAGVFDKSAGKINSIEHYSVEFKQKMDELLNEFFDPNIPYIQTSVEEKCGYCPYASICNREE